MNGRFRKLDHTGDTLAVWADSDEDLLKAMEETPTDKPLTLAEANAEFERMVQGGVLAFVTDEESKRGEQIRQFDPKTHTDVLFVPAFVGG